MELVVFFPVKPHLKKFLEKRFGPFTYYSNKHILAPYIRSALSTAVKTRQNAPFKTDHSYPVFLSQYYTSKFGVIYQKEKNHQFNHEIEILFRDYVYQFMNLNKEIYGIKYRTSLKDVLKTFEIHEEDLKLDSILRDFNRKHQDPQISDLETTNNKKILSMLLQ